jgi:Amidohydrolase family
MNAVRVAEEGATTIEHHYGYPEASFTDRQIQKLPANYNYSSEPERFYETGASWLQADLPKLHKDVIDSLLATSAKTGFTMVPTMVVYEANRDIERAKSLPWLADFAMPAIMEHWSPSPKSHGSYFYHWTSDNEADWAQMYRRWQDFVEDYKNRGGKVAVGSDVGSIYSLWGFATIREIALLEECGFSPLEALHSATEVGAISLGNHQLGVIRPGYLADLVILTANPLEDIKVMYGTGATRQSEDGHAIQVKAVKYTIRDGVVIDSQALLRDVQEIVAKAKADQVREKK